MFYKLIHKDLDKRKKIAGEVATFEGLLAYATRAFKLEGKNVGFLFLGADDVSAYEVACDDDLEYVIDATKSYSNSKFVTIKLVENIETAPENPERFSTVGEELAKEESFDMIGSSSVRQEVELVELKTDLEEFDAKLLNMAKKEEEEDIKMIQDIGDMVENVIIEEEKEMKKLNEELEKIDLPPVTVGGSNVYHVDYEVAVPEVVIPEVVIPEVVIPEVVIPPVKVVIIEDKKVKKNLKKEKKQKKQIKKIHKKKKEILKKKEIMARKLKKFEKKLVKLEKRQEKIQPTNSLKMLAEKISESILLTGEEKEEDVQSKLSELLNETLGQINLKLEEKQKDMNTKKQAKKMAKYMHVKDKFQDKAHNMNQKMAKMYSKLTLENQAKIPLEQLIFTSQMGMAPSRELESYRFEVDHLTAENLQLQDKFETISNRALELDAKLQSLQDVCEVTDKSSGRKVTVETAHMNITCDKCGVHNFKGRRFKCMVCPNFDLCEKCENSHIHGHPMIRMTSNTAHSAKLDWVLNFVREKPMFKHIFNLASVGNDNMTPPFHGRRGPRGRGHKKGRGGFPWWKMFFGGKKWGKCTRKDKESSSEDSSSSDSDVSKSPKHRGGRRGGRGGRRGHPWRHMARMFQKGGNFPLGPFCGKRGGFKNGWVEHSPETHKKRQIERKRRQEERKKRRQAKRQDKIKNLVPEELKKSLELAGVEIVDAYVTNKNSPAPVSGVEVGTNTIEVEIPIKKECQMQTETVKQEDKCLQNEEDMMKEDKIIRKPSVSFIVEDEKVSEPLEDFKIEEEKVEETNDEKEIRERKEYMRMVLAPHQINTEILHFFVVSNLDLDKATFSKFVETQKNYLLK